MSDISKQGIIRLARKAGVKSLSNKCVNVIRELMHELSKVHSIIISTHILSEVEAICDRVLIINEGNIVLDQYLKELLADNNSLESVFLRLTSDKSQ